jgi:hypothetical protein
MAISEFFSLKIWQLWHKNPSYELHRSFFFGQEAKIQKFKKKKKTALLRFGVANYTLGSGELQNSFMPEFLPLSKELNMMLANSFQRLQDRPLDNFNRK